MSVSGVETAVDFHIFVKLVRRAFPLKLKGEALGTRLQLGKQTMNVRR